MHMSEKPYNCTFCSKRYCDTQSLKEHVASHIDNKYYKCSECDEQFPNSEALEKHSDDHKGEIVVGF
jgi:KRAB domain-containing zinc finger protein